MHKISVFFFTNNLSVRVIGFRDTECHGRQVKVGCLSCGGTEAVFSRNRTEQNRTPNQISCKLLESPHVTFNLEDWTANEIKYTLFYIFLTVHSNIMTVFLYQLDAQILYFSTFITFLYMFRALLCSSLGGQIVLVQHLVSSLSLGDDTRCCTNIICPPKDEHNSARNM